MNQSDDNVYILYVKRYTIITYGGLESWLTHDNVYTLYVKRIVFKNP
jgi:hypothetical protein